jgi:hypothetical protein
VAIDILPAKQQRKSLMNSTRDFNDWWESANRRLTDLPKEQAEYIWNAALSSQAEQEQEQEQELVPVQIAEKGNLFFRTMNCGEWIPVDNPQAPAIPEARPVPELMMASYHEAIGWNDCREAMLSATDKQEGAK